MLLMTDWEMVEPDSEYVYLYLCAHDSVNEWNFSREFDGL